MRSFARQLDGVDNWYDDSCKSRPPYLPGLHYGEVADLSSDDRA